MAMGMMSMGVAVGSTTRITAITNARLVLVAVTTASMPNIWRISVRLSEPSASHMAQLSRAMVISPPT